MAQVRRRNRQREQYWRDAIAGHLKSGQSIREFCAGRGLAEANFYAWRRELAKREGQSGPAPAVKFVPVRVQLDANIEVVLPNGVVVRVPASADAAAVAKLVAALRAGSC